MGLLGIVGAAASLAGTIIQMQGQKKAANAAADAAQRQALQEQQAKDFEAAQLNQNAGQEVAASQRAALDERRRAQLIASRAIAVNAASGGSGSDPSVISLLADISGEGAYRAGVALYQGEDKARQLRMGADARSYEGAVAIERGDQKARDYREAGKTSAMSTLFSGVGSMFTKYGGAFSSSPGATGTTGTTGSWLDAGSNGLSSIG